MEMQPQQLEDAALGPGPVEEFVRRSYPVDSTIVNRHVIQVMHSLTLYRFCFFVHMFVWSYFLFRVRTGLKSTWIYRTVLKSPWNLNLPWKVLEKHSKAMKSPWILPFTEWFYTVFRDLNQYKIVLPLFGAAYAAPNKRHHNFILIF